MRSACRLLLVLLVSTHIALGNPVNELDYQGRVLVNDLPFQGNGFFKFAITDQTGATNYWSNDGTGAGQPVAHLTNAVFNGVFSSVLGAPPMAAMNPAIFNNGSNLFLRVWFGVATNSFSEMLPAQRIVSSAYAINAGLVGGLSATQIQAAAVSVATNSITLAGDIVGSPHANSIAAGAIVNADVSTTAAIAASKIANTALVTTATFAGDVAGTFGNLQLGAGVVFDAEVNALANIAGTKLQQATTSNVGAAQFAVGAVAPLRAIDDSDARLNAFGIVNTHTASAPNSAFSITGGSGIAVSNMPGNVVHISIAGPSGIPLQNVYFVATNGLPGNTGTISSPLDDPQAAYSLAAAGGLPAAVVIAAGNFGASNLQLTNGDVHVIGFGRPELGSLTVSATPSASTGKQRVEGIVFLGNSAIDANGDRTKLFNCNFLDGLFVDADGVEIQSCHFARPQSSGSALVIGQIAACDAIGIYQSSIQNNDFGAAALNIGTVGALEVIGCEIVNEEGASGAAISDQTIATPVLHQYSYNYIKGPTPGAGSPAVVDPVGLLVPTILFTHNTVYGDVGVPQVLPPSANLQYFANNVVFGQINYTGGQVGWFQAVTPNFDAANNSEYPGPAPVLPSHWDD